MPRPRVVSIAPPEQLGRHEGLAYALFLPEGEPLGGVLILHGAGSAKESHYDFARACRAHGLAALAFDARGHGESDGALGRAALADLAAMARLLPAGAPLALRGSSMGGYLAIVAAAGLGARAVVAICPASAQGMRRGLHAGAFDFRADTDALDALLAEHDEMLAARDLDVPLLLLHAEGDERVPVEHSRALAGIAPRARLIAVPGGHHRSVQHDGELQATALRWLEKTLRDR
jgi:alpha-beta hydrolase superfamily lysophospholipase